MFCSLTVYREILFYYPEDLRPTHINTYTFVLYPSICINVYKNWHNLFMVMPWDEICYLAAYYCFVPTVWNTEENLRNIIHTILCVYGIKHMSGGRSIVMKFNGNCMNCVWENWMFVYGVCVNVTYYGFINFQFLLRHFH